MKISYNWLKDYIKLDESPEKVGEWLTGCGLEVEGIEKTESVKGGLKGLVIGEVLTCDKHPDADKLTVTTVNTGKEILPIVCGAHNVAKGQKVVVATVGTTLHTIKGESFEIKKAKIRGQVSEGMICAEDEIGLGPSHDGIMVLEPYAEVGTPAAEYFNVEEDYCIEIGLTPNRVDAASHIGVARDLVAVISHLHPEKKPTLNFPDISRFKTDNQKSGIRIILEDPQACPRYAGVCISGVKVGESPDWLKNRLKSIGLKPINNLVDITNFVLHETGQPLHAFDAAAIKGERVVVKKSPKDKPFITLDEEEIKLSGEDLMICNLEEPMCIGGILGGLHSGVTSETKDIFLESAYFNPGTIRRSSKNHGIKTDASFRFERGADPEMTLYALKRAALLIKEIAGGEISSEIMDAYPQPIIPVQLRLNYEYTDRLIGKVVDRDVIVRILETLKIKILEKDPDGLILEIPPFKVDVTREADVVEEILRIYGYNNVEIPERLHSSIVSSPKPDKEKLQNIASDFLSSRGFVEIMNNSLSKASYYNDEIFDSNSVVTIMNPLSQDLNTMRQTLFFGGLEVVEWNQNRRVHDIKTYEFGNVYFKTSKSGDAHNDLSTLDGYREQRMLGLFMTGNIKPESWYEKDRPSSLFDLKAEMVAVIKRMNVDMEGVAVEEIHNQSFFHTGLRYSINGKVLAEIGEVCERYLKVFDLKQDVFYASVNWEYLIELSNRKEIRFAEIPRFPEVRRDLALLLGKNVQFSEIEKIARGQERKLLKNVRLFDVYHDEKIGKDMKSYAVSFTLQDESKTLTDKEIDKVMEKIARALQQQLNASIR
jgi:phenylalanyl-tRNA synthetase beta chain